MSPGGAETFQRIGCTTHMVDINAINLRHCNETTCMPHDATTMNKQYVIKVLSTIYMSYSSRYDTHTHMVMKQKEYNRDRITYYLDT